MRNLRSGYGLLRDLEELDIPAVHGVGVVTGQRDARANRCRACWSPSI